MVRRIKDMKYEVGLAALILVGIALVIASPRLSDVSNVDAATGDANERSQRLIVPVHVYIVHYEDPSLSSSRDAADIDRVFSNVKRLWAQAEIDVVVENIETITLPDSLADSTRALHTYVVDQGPYDPAVINAYFSKHIGGPNGIAFPQNVIMVADRTSVFDYRATAHEIGHELGLQHVPPQNRLMAQGVNGFDLVAEEIAIARANTARLFPDSLF